MIHVTEKAGQALLESLQANASEEAQGLRLTHIAGQGYGLALDTERAGDQVVQQQGRKVLLVAETIAEQLEGAVLDAVDSPEGPRLSLQTSDTEA